MEKCCPPPGHKSSLERRFIGTFVINGALAIGELIVSVITGSTAVLADAFMNLDDLAALALSIYSERKTRQAADEKRTFGYKRMDPLAGFLKGCLLLLSALIVFLQAGRLLLEPKPPAGITILIVGIISLSVNLISSLLLKKNACHSLNARSTYLCMVYDTIGSISIIISALLSFKFPVVYFDVASALLIAFFMVKSGREIFTEGINLFLQSAPEAFDYAAFEKKVLTVPGVSSVGDIHVWMLTPTEHHLTCKVVIMENDACECHRILHQIETICRRHFNINHCTIQPIYTGEILKKFCKA